MFLTWLQCLGTAAPAFPQPLCLQLLGIPPSLRAEPQTGCWDPWQTSLSLGHLAIEGHYCSVLDYIHNPGALPSAMWPHPPLLAVPLSSHRWSVLSPPLLPVSPIVVVFQSGEGISNCQANFQWLLLAGFLFSRSTMS